MFKSGDYDKAADILGNVLDVIEEEYKGVRKAGMIDKELVIRKSEGDGQIWLCTNHIMEYHWGISVKRIVNSLYPEDIDNEELNSIVDNYQEPGRRDRRIT